MKLSRVNEIKSINTVKGSDFILNIFLLNRHIECGENTLKYTLTHLLFIVLWDIKIRDKRRRQRERIMDSSVDDHLEVFLKKIIKL